MRRPVRHPPSDVLRIPRPPRVAGRRLDGTALERTLFALVANRALAPSSKLAVTGWVAGDVHIEGLDQVSGDACYRAMDELHAMEGDVGKKVYDSLASLLNLEAPRPGPRRR